MGGAGGNHPGESLGCQGKGSRLVSPRCPAGLTPSQCLRACDYSSPRDLLEAGHLACLEHSHRVGHFGAGGRVVGVALA
jgi:hypothetical protein